MACVSNGFNFCTFLEIILYNYDIVFDFQLPLALYFLTTLFKALLAMCAHVRMYVLLSVACQVYGISGSVWNACVGEDWKEIPCVHTLSYGWLSCASSPMSSKLARAHKVYIAIHYCHMHDVPSGRGTCM